MQWASMSDGRIAYQCGRRPLATRFEQPSRCIIPITWSLILISCGPLGDRSRCSILRGASCPGRQRPLFTAREKYSRCPPLLDASSLWPVSPVSATAKRATAGRKASSRFLRRAAKPSFGKYPANGSARRNNGPTTPSSSLGGHPSPGRTLVATGIRTSSCGCTTRKPNSRNYRAIFGG